MKFNNTHIYKDLNDPAIQSDFDQALRLQDELTVDANTLDTSDANALAAWLTKFDNVQITFMDIGTFAALISVIDSTIDAADALEAKSNQLHADLQQLAEPVRDKIMQLNDAEFENLISNEALEAFRFQLKHERRLSIHRLSVKEETLLKKMAVDGLNAWGEQYSKLAGTLSCNIQGEELGLASAFNLTMSANRDTRESAWKGIQQAWGEHQNSVVAGLNAINGWRLNEFERRSAKKEMHYLDVACHQSHIERTTLDVLMTTAFENRSTGQLAINLMNGWNQISDAKPWDLSAPARANDISDKTITYQEGLQIIKDAFSEFDPDMAEFVTKMNDNGWIDAKPTENRATGAFCTEFYAAKEPRVFMTYDGTMSNVLTLAHELGHAWHAWLY